MFECREQNFITGLKVGTEAVSREVDGIGAARRENQLIGVSAAKVRGYRFSGILVGGGGGAGERVGATVDVRVDRFVIGARGVEYGERFLRGRGIVQIDQGLAIDWLVKDGKKLACWQWKTHGGEHATVPLFFHSVSSRHEGN